MNSSTNKKIVVGVADMKLSNNPAVSIVTYSLGSCVGVAVYDPLACVGGMLHYMLPDSSVDRNKRRVRLYMFADTGIPNLFREAYKMGAAKDRLIVKIAGGSNIMDDKKIFGIGEKNYMAAKKIFAKNNVKISNEDVGGKASRTLYLDIASGNLLLRFSGEKKGTLI